MRTPRVPPREMSGRRRYPVSVDTTLRGCRGDAYPAMRRTATAAQDNESALPHRIILFRLRLTNGLPVFILRSDAPDISMHPTRWTGAFIFEGTWRDFFPTRVIDFTATVIERRCIQVGHVHRKFHCSLWDTRQGELWVWNGVRISRIAITDIAPRKARDFEFIRPGRRCERRKRKSRDNTSY